MPPRPQPIEHFIAEMTWRFGFTGWVWSTDMLVTHVRVLRDTKPEDWHPFNPPAK